MISDDCLSVSTNSLLHFCVDDNKCKRYEDDESRISDDVASESCLQEAPDARRRHILSRLKMEQHARFLLGQATLVETSTRGRKNRITQLLESSKLKTPSSSVSLSKFHLPIDIALLSTTDEGEPGADDSIIHFKQRISELENDNERLRESVSRCSASTISIQENADLKAVRMECEVAHLRQKLAEETATNVKLVVIEQSLRKQLNMTAPKILLQKNTDSLTIDKKHYNNFVRMRQRELALESNLNGLIISRHKALMENTALKKLIYRNSCIDCRERLPIGLLRRLECNADDQCKSEDPNRDAASMIPSHQTHSEPIEPSLTNKRRDQSPTLTEVLTFESKLDIASTRDCLLPISSRIDAVDSSLVRQASFLSNETADSALERNILPDEEQQSPPHSPSSSSSIQQRSLQLESQYRRRELTTDGTLHAQVPPDKATPEIEQSEYGQFGSNKSQAKSTINFVRANARSNYLSRRSMATAIRTESTAMTISAKNRDISLRPSLHRPILKRELSSAGTSIATSSDSSSILARLTGRSDRRLVRDGTSRFERLTDPSSSIEVQSSDAPVLDGKVKPKKSRWQQRVFRLPSKRNLNGALE